MRPLPEMETIQIEITNACINQCSNCTRLCGHIKPFYMTLDEVKRAIDSLEDFPNRIGIMGGESLLHPDFEQICKYLQSKKEGMKCGLWTTLPKEKKNTERL
jgi:MoaA/NifB/PqqE/SkfB family radical SAM enzyme